LNPNHPLSRFGKVTDWKLKGENALRTSGEPGASVNWANFFKLLRRAP
jgi:hypothetical protein